MDLSRAEIDEMLRRADEARRKLRRATRELEAFGELLLRPRDRAPHGDTLGMYGEPPEPRDADLAVAGADAEAAPAALDHLGVTVVAGILRVRGADLDIDYIERWVAELGLAEPWRRARAAAPA